MRKAEVGRQVMMAAAMFAYETFLRDHPVATEEAAVAHAELHWREHVEMALDFLALQAGLEEKEAAPWN